MPVVPALETSVASGAAGTTGKSDLSVTRVLQNIPEK